jgi:dUTP pyrophosphatase
MINKNIASFEKVSFDEYKKARKLMFSVENELTEDEMFDEWLAIKLPERSTSGSAGYDFCIPMKYEVQAEKSVLFPTGIRAKIDEGWVLMLFPRSGLGTKYGMGLDNTVGIIDSDYYYADNEGHIMAKIHVSKPLKLEEGTRFIQGVFVPFGTADKEEVTTERHGGLGSTGTK